MSIKKLLQESDLYHTQIRFPENPFGSIQSKKSLPALFAESVSAGHHLHCIDAAEIRLEDRWTEERLEDGLCLMLFDRSEEALYAVGIDGFGWRVMAVWRDSAATILAYRESFYHTKAVYRVWHSSIKRRVEAHCRNIAGSPHIGIVLEVATSDCGITRYQEGEAVRLGNVHQMISGSDLSYAKAVNDLHTFFEVNDSLPLTLRKEHDVSDHWWKANDEHFDRTIDADVIVGSIEEITVDYCTGIMTGHLSLNDTQDERAREFLIPIAYISPMRLKRNRCNEMGELIGFCIEDRYSFFKLDDYIDPVLDCSLSYSDEDCAKSMAALK